mmetsp:Transcript_23159/g.37568  ORF Transcript_23159/g.37568 Transcript_23159/m.37568 type:complete len:219 (+) Transcript_23159:39-695(+)
MYRDNQIASHVLLHTNHVSHLSLYLHPTPRSKHGLQLLLKFIHHVAPLPESLHQDHPRLHGHLPHALHQIHRRQSIRAPRRLQRPNLLHGTLHCLGELPVTNPRGAAPPQIDRRSIRTRNGRLPRTQVILQLIRANGRYLRAQQLVQQSHARIDVFLEFLLRARVNVLQDGTPIGPHGGLACLPLHFLLSFSRRQRGRYRCFHSVLCVEEGGVLDVHA